MVCSYFQAFIVYNVLFLPFTEQLFLPGKQEVCFHIILILIKAHLFSSSQKSPLKCHLQHQVLGHGLSSSLKSVAASSYFLEKNLEKSNTSEAQESFLCLPEKIDTT